MKKAVIIGAGNIGRGLNSFILNKNNYEITFLDINEKIIEELNKKSLFKIKEIGSIQKEIVIDKFQAINLNKNIKKAIDAISESELILISVGLNNLKYLLNILNASLRKYISGNLESYLNIVAIENGINVSELLKNKLLLFTKDNNLKDFIINNKKIAFVNCAVDRIVPNQNEAKLNVIVEQFYELVLDNNTWLGPKIKYVKYSNDLGKFIKRKLFMLNAVHACISWYGIKNDFKYINEFIKDPQISNLVNKLLNTFSEILEKKFSFTKSDLFKYSEEIKKRLSNMLINDSVKRVGRNVIQKIGPNNRFSLAIKYAKEFNINYSSILEAMSYAFLNLKFQDNEAQEINLCISQNSLSYAIKKYTDLSNLDTKKLISIVENIDL